MSITAMTKDTEEHGGEQKAVVKDAFAPHLEYEWNTMFLSNAGVWSIFFPHSV